MLENEQLVIPGMEVPRHKMAGPFTSPGRVFSKKIVLNDKQHKSYIVPAFIINALLISLLFGCLIFDKLPIKLKSPPSPAAIALTNVVNKIRVIAGISPILTMGAPDVEEIGDLPEMVDSNVIDLTAVLTGVTFICSTMSRKRKKFRESNFSWN